MIVRALTLPIVLMSLLSCAPDAARTTTEPMEQAPDRSSLLMDWNRRAESIDAMHALGIAELRWIDEDGDSRMEQGELDLWFEAPDRLAIRISKFGETYLVYGSNGVDDWLYTNQSEELVKWPSEREVDFILSDIDLLLVSLGLRRLPVGSLPGAATWDASQGAWEFQVEGISGAPVTWWIDEGAKFPSRMAVTASGYEVTITEDQSRTRTVKLPGTPITASPKLPGSLTIMSRNAEDTDYQRTLVVFDEVSVDTEGQPMDRVFDVDAMEAGLKPRSVRVLGNEPVPFNEDSRQ